MNVLKWYPDFSVDAEPHIVPIWLGFPNFPLHIFKKKALFAIAGLFVHPIMLGTATLNLTRPSVARIRTEIDISQDLPLHFWIQCGDNGFIQDVVHENVTNLCKKCSIIGHSLNQCENQWNAPRPPPHFKSIWVEKDASKGPPVAQTDKPSDCNNLDPLGIPYKGQRIVANNEVLFNNDQPAENRGMSGLVASHFAASTNTPDLVEQQEKQSESHDTGDKEHGDLSDSNVFLQEEDDQTNQIEDAYFKSRSRKGKKPMVDADGYITPNPKKTRKRRDYSTLERTIVTRSLDPSRKEISEPPKQLIALEPVATPDLEEVEYDKDNDPVYRYAYKMAETDVVCDDIDAWMDEKDEKTFQKYINRVISADMYLQIRKGMFMRMVEEYKTNPDFKFRDIPCE